MKSLLYVIWCELTRRVTLIRNDQGDRMYASLLRGVDGIRITFLASLKIGTTSTTTEIGLDPRTLNDGIWLFNIPEMTLSDKMIYDSVENLPGPFIF